MRDRSVKKHTYAREKIYCVYKGDIYVMDGTWKEVVNALGISESTLRYYLSKSYLNRIKKEKNKRLKIEPIGEIKNGEEILYEDNY